MTMNLENFEQKKVQEVKGSFYIYLPKAWCVKYGLDVAKKRVVYLKNLPDDSLLIRSDSKTIEEESLNEINLDIDMERDKDIGKEEYVDYLFNLILTSYIIGYRTIYLNMKEKIPLKIKNRIHKMTQKLYGMVVIRESKTEIVIEEHLDEIDLKVLSKQLLTKVGLLIDNYIEIIEDYSKDFENFEIIDELIEQDNQIDQHRYAIERYVHQILVHPSLGHLIGTTSVECLHYSETTRFIEQIGDNITKLAKLLKKQPITDKKFVIHKLRTLKEIYITMHDNFWRTDSLRLFALTRDINEFGNIIKLSIYEDHADTEYLIPIRRSCNLCGDIAEIRINDILSKKQSASNHK